MTQRPVSFEVNARSHFDRDGRKDIVIFVIIIISSIRCKSNVVHTFGGQEQDSPS
ncbi:MAG: hypothetical protein ACR2GY_01835 [Phycisphaerales bacterium]